MRLTTRNPASRTVEIGAVTVLLLFAAALRILGISSGAPDMAYFPADAAQNLLPIEAPIHPDEFLYVTTPLHMRAKHRLNPDFFENPTFLINLNLLTYIVTDTGSDLVWEEIKEIGQRQIAPFALYVIGRWYSVLGGLLAVAATYAAARVVAGRFAALSAGLLVAVALPMVQHAHYATTSSLAAGFVALCLWASLAFVRQRRWWLFVVACLAAGFAATNRYNAAAVALVPFALGVVLMWRRKVKPLPVLLAWFGVPLAFLIGSPQILRDFSKFIADFRYIYSGYAVTGQGAMGFTVYGLLYEYRYLITVALGIPGALAALIGVGALGRAPRRESRLLLFLLLAYILPYSLVVLRTVRPSYSDQLLVPVIPAFAILIGVGAAALARIPALRRVRAVIPVLLIGTPLLFTLPVVQRFAATDTRLLMTAWITQHIPAGARIHLDGSYNVPLDRTRYSVTQNYAGDFPTLETLCQADYVVFSDAWFNDVERSLDLVSATDLALARGQQALLATQLVEIARIERPPTLGRDLFMHTATYWHDPQIIVYAVPQSACSGG